MIKLTEEQIDVLKEIINLGVGKAASTLNTILGSHIKLSVPSVELLDSDKLAEIIFKEKINTLASVNLAFRGEFSGSAKLIFPTEGASKLVSAFADESDEDDDLDEIRIGTLSEIGNIVLNALMGMISNAFQQRLTYTTPNYLEGDINSILQQERVNYESLKLLATTRFFIESIEISGDFVLFFEIGSLDLLLEKVNQLSERFGE